MIDLAKVKAALQKPRRIMPPGTDDLLSCGSSLTNLACSDKWQGAFPKGRYSIIVGDSGSGKTFMLLTCLAEAKANPVFADHRIIYDNVEDGALMDFEKFFGKRVADTVEPPAQDDAGPIYSETIEELYYHLDDAGSQGKPFIYIVDSMDALSSDYESKKFKEGKTAHRKRTKAKGDYGDGKAKYNSRYIRRAMQAVRDTGSILLVVSQTRDNFDSDMFAPDQVYAGGKALKFYAAFEMWLSVRKRITKKINDRSRQIGIISKVRITKNRLTGKERTVELPIYWSHGIDDTGGLVDYLLAEDYWKKKTGGVILAEDFEVELTREKLIHHIEENDLERQLRMLAKDCWDGIEARLTVSRKKRYE